MRPSSGLHLICASSLSPASPSQTGGRHHGLIPIPGRGLRTLHRGASETPRHLLKEYRKYEVQLDLSQELQPLMPPGQPLRHCWARLRQFLVSRGSQALHGPMKTFEIQDTYIFGSRMQKNSNVQVNPFLITFENRMSALLELISMHIETAWGGGICSFWGDHSQISASCLLKKATCDQSISKAK